MLELKRFIEQYLVPPSVWQKLTMAKDSLQLALMRPEDKHLLLDNKQLKDRHAGVRCFILGAGPSIKEQDIKKLEGEIVISVSNTFVHPDFSLIKPRYHVVPSLIRAHGQLHTENKFIKWLKTMEIATGDAEMFFHIYDRTMIEGNGLFKGRIIHWIEYAGWYGDFATPIDLMRVPSIWSVSELTLTIALYFGFAEIYLIGFDHDWFNGKLSYFFDPRKEHALCPHQIDLRFADSEFQMRRHADIFRKYKYLYSKRNNIYNANANRYSYLDVFPKVNYDKLFVETTTGMKT